MTGFSIIFMHEREDGCIEISAEVIGECMNAHILASQLMQGMLLLEGVNYSNTPNSIAARSTSPAMH